MEELKPSECIAPPWRRRIHFAALYCLGMDGIWKLERLSRAFSKRPKVEIGKVIFDTRPILSHRLSSCSMPRKA